MYDTILVPLDGSKRAEAILAHVENMTQCHPAKVILLQVVEPKPVIGVGTEVMYPMLDQMEYEQQAQQAAAYLAARQAEFREKGIETQTQVAFGPVVEEIISRAEREGADLIAMASHGWTGLARIFYGSVAAGVLHRIDRPLLLIRAELDQ